MNRSELMFPHEPARFDREEFHRLLRHAKGIEASDLHIKTLTRVMCRVHGHLVPVTNRRLEDAEVATILQVLYGSANAELEVRTGKPLDDAYRLTIDRERHLRFRWNAHACEVHGAFGIKITLRELPAKPPRLPKDDLGEAVVNALFPDDGLVLICGATGSGKSTLLAGVVTEKAEDPEADSNIVTLEWPIEFTYDAVKTDSCMITQVAIPQNLPSFARGVVNSLREDPDIVVVGEARDAETIEAALLASQTGHLVYTTVHSNSVGTTFLRLMQSLPVEKASSIMGSLIDSVRLIICQSLFPSTDGKRVAVRETLVFNREIRRELLLTATRNIAELPAVADGMVRRFGQTKLQHAEQLIDAGRLDPLYADLLRADERVSQQLNGTGVSALPAAASNPVTMSGLEPGSEVDGQGLRAAVLDLARRLAAAEALLRVVGGGSQDAAPSAAGTDGQVDHPVSPAASTRAEGDLASVGFERVFAPADLDSFHGAPSQEPGEPPVAPLQPDVDSLAGERASAAEDSPAPSAEDRDAMPAEPDVVQAAQPGQPGEPHMLQRADEPVAPSNREGDSSTDEVIESVLEELLEAEALAAVPASSSAGPAWAIRVIPQAAPQMAPEDTTPLATEIDAPHVTDVAHGRGQTRVFEPFDDAGVIPVVEVPAREGELEIEAEASPESSVDDRDAMNAASAPVRVAEDEPELRPATQADGLVTARPPDLLPMVDALPPALVVRRQLLGEICDALAWRLGADEQELNQVEQASELFRTMASQALPRHQWQQTWVRLARHLELTSETLALRLAGETVFNKVQRIDDAGDAVDGWALVSRARELLREPFFMPRTSDATA